MMTRDTPSNRRERPTPSFELTANEPLEGTNYRTIRPIGVGGSAEVYEVEHQLLKTRFIAKVLRGSLAHSKQAQERMRIEAQSTAALLHDHLVRVTDFGYTLDGRPFIIMECLDGRDLSRALELSGPFSLEDAIRCVRQALSALEFAHQNGIIHRDIKPDNLLLCPVSSGGAVTKVMDLGLAKLLDTCRIEHSKYPTEQGVIVGAPEYLAPEYARGERIDHRVDVFGMGLVLFELLTGKPAFGTQRDPETDCVPPPSKFRRGVPRSLDRIVLRATASKREERFPTAAAFADALTALQRELATHRSHRAITATSAVFFAATTYAALHFVFGR